MWGEVVVFFKRIDSFRLFEELRSDVVLIVFDLFELFLQVVEHFVVVDEFLEEGLVVFGEGFYLFFLLLVFRLEAVF